MNEKLVASEDVQLLPHHIVKTINSSAKRFMHLSKKCPRLSAVKTKKGRFVGAKIKELLQKDFEQCPALKEKSAWPYFKNVKRKTFCKEKKLIAIRRIESTKGKCIHSYISALSPFSVKHGKESIKCITHIFIQIMYRPDKFLFYTV